MLTSIVEWFHDQLRDITERKSGNSLTKKLKKCLDIFLEGCQYNKQMKTADHPTVGRPMADVTIPKGKFTFNQLCAVNKNLAPLTLRNFMDRDKDKGKHSEILRVEDERGEPGSKIGRKPFLYIRRELLSKSGIIHQNVGYHVHKSKAPTHTMKRTELPKGRSHQHHIVDLDKAVGGSSITISFAPVPKGAPMPASVTVNFVSKSSTCPESITINNPESHAPEKTSEDTPTIATIEESEGSSPVPVTQADPAKK